MRRPPVPAVLPGRDAAAPSATAGPRDVEIVSLAKSYGGPHVVRDVTFTLRQGEFLTLLGPSGSGKSTTLLMVAGFEQPSRGDIRIGGRSIVDEPPQRRNFGVVFQSYALFPHMSVIENVEFPLRMRGMSPRERRARAADMLDKVGLSLFARRKPRELSGGQQQRVALARALIFDPAALLLDEPLGALDKRLRESMQIEIKSIQRRTGISVLYVTHDQEEAMVMSDRIAIMRDGRLLQIGAPSDLYRRPATPFVAAALGETNLVPCRRVEGDGPCRSVVLPDGSGGRAQCADPQQDGTGERCAMISVRPERIRCLLPGEAAENTIEGVVKDQTFAGSYVRCTIQACGQDLIMKTGEDGPAAAARPGQRVRIGWRTEDAQILYEE
ncbi:MAG TPA: ABC transporter ATP-binding protein [bacterium]|nr:ABC transporter ATP-binding protein [bacterium]